MALSAARSEYLYEEGRNAGVTEEMPRNCTN